jgi:hypothetical protein
MASSTDGGAIYNIKVKQRSNAGVRLRSCKGIKIYNCIIDGSTRLSYSPGIQIQSTAVNWTISDIEICNNYIHDTLGPGIQVASNVPNNGLVYIHNNLIVNCGLMPATNKISGVGGIEVIGIPVEISNNTIDKCKGYSILLGPYDINSTYKATAVIKYNIITNTTPSYYPGTISGTGIADLTAGKFSVTVDKNCQYGNKTANHYQITYTNSLSADPLYAGNGDYHLKSKGGRYTSEGTVYDSASSPCIFPEMELGFYNGSNEASEYYYPPTHLSPSEIIGDHAAIIIICQSEDSATKISTAIREAEIIGSEKLVVYTPN